MVAIEGVDAPCGEANVTLLLRQRRCHCVTQFGWKTREAKSWKEVCGGSRESGISDCPEVDLFSKARA